MLKKISCFLIIISFVYFCQDGELLREAFASAAISSQQDQQRQQQQAREQAQQQKQSSLPESFQKASEEVIDLVDIWRELDYSSEIWPLIIDRAPKEMTVQEYINLYRERGVNINKSAAHYVAFIDSLLRDRKELLTNPFKDVLRFAAIVEYDFDNGQNKDEMALRLLGENVFRENKQRLGY